MVKAFPRSDGKTFYARKRGIERMSDDKNIAARIADEKVIRQLEQLTEERQNQSQAVREALRVGLNQIYDEDDDESFFLNWLEDVSAVAAVGAVVFVLLALAGVLSAQAAVANARGLAVMSRATALLTQYLRGELA